MHRDRVSATSPISRRLNVWTQLHLCRLEAVVVSRPLLPGDVLQIRPVVESVEIGAPATRVPPGSVSTHGTFIGAPVSVKRAERMTEVVAHRISYERVKTATQSK